MIQHFLLYLGHSARCNVIEHLYGHHQELLMQYVIMNRDGNQKLEIQFYFFWQSVFRLIILSISSRKLHKNCQML